MVDSLKPSMDSALVFVIHPLFFFFFFCASVTPSLYRTLSHGMPACLRSVVRSVGRARRRCTWTRTRRLFCSVLLMIRTVSILMRTIAAMLLSPFDKLQVGLLGVNVYTYPVLQLFMTLLVQVQKKLVHV